MTLLFLDSFDHYTTTDMNSKWDVGSGTSVNDPPSIALRQSRGIGREDSSNFWEYSYVSSFSAHAVIYFGTAFYYDRSDGVLQLQCLRSLSGQSAVELNYYTDHIQMYRGGDGTPSADVAYTLPRFTWAYIEFAVFTHLTAGWVVVRINGIEVLNVTGINTKAVLTVDTDINGITMSGADVYFDDLYIANGAASQTFLGPIYVHAIAPRGGTAVQQSTLFGGGARIENAQGSIVAPGNRVRSISGKNLISSTQADLFVYHPLTLPSGGVRAVQVTVCGRRTSGGIDVYLYQPLHGGILTTASVGALTTSFIPRYVYFPFENNPATSAPWTLVDVNALQAGYKGDNASGVEITHCLLEVAVSAAGGYVPDYMPAEPLYMIA